MCVYLSLARNDIMMALYINRHKRLYSLLLHLCYLLFCHLQLANSRPDRKTINLQLSVTKQSRGYLIPIVIEDSFL